MITLINLRAQDASSIFVPNGSISLQLNVDATVVATPFGFVCADIPIVFQLDGSGNILPNAPATSAQIWSNAELNPQNSVGLGTYYLVTIYDANGARLNATPLWWQFPQAANATVDISQMVPFMTEGGNVIFYPTSFTIPTPTISTLGGVFSSAAVTSQWLTAINTDGTVSRSQPAFTDISGTISAGQLPTSVTFTSFTVTGLITGQGNIELGVIGSLSGQITLDGSTSGQATITAPAIAGTSANPILFSNGINIPAGTIFSINTDTGLSRDSAGVIDVGNGTAGNKSGSINLTGLTATGAVSAASLTVTGATAIFGTIGTTSGVLTLRGATSGSATITAPAVAGTVTNPIAISNSIQIPSGTVYQINTDTGLSRNAAGVINVGNGTAGDASGTIQAAIANFGSFSITSAKISKYNNITTVSGGVPIIVAKSLLTAQNAAITATTIYAIPAAQAGLYRITYVATVTTVDGATSTLGGSTGFQVKFTNANGDAVTKTSNPTTVNVSSVDNVGTTISGTVTGYAASSSNLQYLFGYTSGTPGNMHYDLAIFVEYLGS